MKEIDIIKYINKLEKGEITQTEIADYYNTSLIKIHILIQKYYKNIKKEMPDFKKIINDRKEKITVTELAKKCKLDAQVVCKRIKRYYSENSKEPIPEKIISMLNGIDIIGLNI